MARPATIVCADCARSRAAAILLGALLAWLRWDDGGNMPPHDVRPNVLVQYTTPRNRKGQCSINLVASVAFLGDTITYHNLQQKAVCFHLQFAADTAAWLFHREKLLHIACQSTHRVPCGQYHRLLCENLG